MTIRSALFYIIQLQKNTMIEGVMRQKIGNGSTNAADAVGMSKKYWFVAIVNNNSEKAYGEKLKKLGYESYVPIQSEIHHWRNGKVKTINRVVLPSIVFVCSTEAERKEIVKLPFIKRFMSNQARKEDRFHRHPVAVVPDCQIEQLRFMLENSESAVSIETLPLHLGDKIRVNKGNLRGLEGNIIRCNDEDSYIVIQLECFGCAKMRVSLEDVEWI